MKLPFANFLTSAGIAILAKGKARGKHIVSDQKAKDLYTNYKSKFIEIDGNEIHYRKEGKGPVLMLLHGFGASLHVWDDWVEYLSKDFTLIRVDLPGFGLSSPIRNQITIDYYTAFVHSFLAKLEIDTCYLAGNSLGGWISWEYAVLHPEKIEKLILLNAAGYQIVSSKTPPGVKIATTPKFKELLKNGVPKLLVRHVLKKSFGQKRRLSRTMIERYYVLSNREGNLASYMTLAGSEPVAHPEKLSNLKTNTLILWGGVDGVIHPDKARLFERDLVNSQLIMYEKAGHCLMVEEAKATARDAATFLSA